MSPRDHGAVLTERRVWKASPNRPRRRRTALDLTPEEQANVRRAQKLLEQRYGGRAGLATELGIEAEYLKNAAKRSSKPQVALALAFARCVGVSVEELLGGDWPAPGACPWCGRCG